jgi:hypothetical protein
MYNIINKYKQVELMKLREMPAKQKCTAEAETETEI